MSDKLKKNTYSLILQILFVNILMFIFYRYLTYKIGIEGVGLWSVILSVVSATKIAEVGLSSSLTRYVSLYLSRKEFQNIYIIISTASTSILFIYLILSPIIYYGIFYAIPFFVSESELNTIYSILPYAIVSFVLSSYSSVFMSSLDGCQRMDLRSSISVASYFLMLILVFVLLPLYKLRGVAISQICQSLFIFFVSWYMLRKKLNIKSLFPIGWSRNHFKIIFKYGINVQVASFSILMFDPLTKLMIYRYGGATSVGYFEISSQVVQRIRSLIVSANQSIIPLVSELFETNVKKINELFISNIKILIPLSILIYSILISFSGIASSILLGGVHREFIFALELISISWFINTLITPIYYINLGVGHVKYNTIAHLLIAFVNVFLGLSNGYFIGKHGVYISYAFALCTGSIYLYIKHKKYWQIDYKLIPVKKYIVLLFISMCICILSHFFWINEIEGYKYRLFLILICILNILLLYITFNLLAPSGVLPLLRSNKLISK